MDVRRRQTLPYKYAHTHIKDDALRLPPSRTAILQPQTKSESVEKDRMRRPTLYPPIWRTNHRDIYRLNARQNGINYQTWSCTRQGVECPSGRVRVWLGVIPGHTYVYTIILQTDQYV